MGTHPRPRKPSRLRGLCRRFAMLRRAVNNRDVDIEVTEIDRAWIQRRTRQLIAEDLTPPAARMIAVQELGVRKKKLRMQRATEPRRPVDG